MTTTTTPAARVSGTISLQMRIAGWHDAADYVAGEWIQSRILAAIQPDPEPQPVGACFRCGGSGLYLNDAGEPDECPKCHGDTVLPAMNDPEPQPVAFGRQHFEPKRDSDRQPWDAAPSSAGTVSVEAAAKALLAKCPNPIFDQLKPVLMGEVTERVGYTDEDGNEAYYDRPVSWDAMKTIIRAALRALAGEGGR